MKYPGVQAVQPPQSRSIRGTRGRGTRRRAAPRRGATLVLVAITLFVLFGLAALAIDVARLTAFRGQLKGIADAAAMSAALDLADGVSTVGTATTNAASVVSANPVAGTGTATLTTVEQITWNFASAYSTSNPVNPASANSWSVANGVRAIVSYTIPWTFARLFNRGASRVLVDTSIAALGQRLTHECLRPFAFPLATLMRQVRGNGQANSTTPLTDAEIYTLATTTSTAAQTYTPAITASATSTTSYGFANTRTGTLGTVTDIEAAISGCLSEGTGVNSTLKAVPLDQSAGGNNKPQTQTVTSIRTAMQSLCGGASNCTANNIILVPIYDSGVNTNGSVVTIPSGTSTLNQTYPLTINDACYKKVQSNGLTGLRNEKSCKNYSALLPTASNNSPVYFPVGAATPTAACRSGPGTGWTLISQSGSGKKVTYTVGWPYTSCVTTTTTTSGSGTLQASTYTIRYIAAFMWTVRDNTTGSITGYFTTINYPPDGGGTWGNTPGPVTSAVLVY
jgi:Flp pilus assembly protein TadG